MSKNEPDSPSNPFSDYHSTNTPIEITKPISIKERSHFFEQQAQNSYQNNALKSPTLRSTPLSPKIRQSQTIFQQVNSYNEIDKRSSYISSSFKNNTTIHTNGITKNIKTDDIDNPFSDSNKIVPSPSDEINPVSNSYLNSNSIRRGNMNKSVSPLVPNKPLALRTSPRFSPTLNPTGLSVSPTNKRVNDVEPQSVGLSNDFKKLHLNIAKNNDVAISNPFSPVDVSPSPMNEDELGSGMSPLIKNDDKKHDKHKKHESHKDKKRISLRASHFKHNKDKSTSKFASISNYEEQSQESTNSNTNYLSSNYTLSPKDIQSSQIYANSTSRPVPIPKASTVSGSTSHSFRQSLQMPILEPSPASKLRASNIQHSSTTLQAQQPPPIPERPNLHNKQLDGIYANNTISDYYSSNTQHDKILPSNTVSSHYPAGEKIASRRAVIKIDTTKSNRACPTADGYNKIELPKHPKCIAFCGQYLYAGVSNLSVYNTKTGMPSNIVAIDEKIKITSILLVPGQYLVDEGNIVWAGTDKGAIYEIDINTSRIKYTRNISNYSIIGIFYSGNKIWVVSEKSVAIWTRNETDNSFKLSDSPITEHSLADISEFDNAYILEEKLWLCSQKVITVLGPYPHFVNKKSVNLKVLMGRITCISEAGLNSGELYTGHDDGKITIWDIDNVVAKEVFSVSYYNITSILTVNDKHVWVGLSTGKICVFDSSVKPWKKIKDFEAHFHSGVVQLTRDPFYPYALVPPYTSVANSALSVVSSLSEDGEVHFWDAFLSEDYINSLIKDQETYYSERSDITLFVTTYNCDSTKPQELLSDEFNKKFFDNWFKVLDSPDIIVVGLQEIVDLESKAVNAKSFFKKAKKKSKKDKLDNRQQIWVDAIKNNLLNSQNEQYENISCTQMVGLFLAVFVKPSLNNRISCLNVDTVETGLKGYHGNKGSIALRMLIDDSSVCIINTHLAAHQDQVVARNNDVVTIMNETKFPPHDKPCCYVNGGDGSQIMDYENVFWFGDMNYRIDPINNLTRDDIIKMANEKRFDELIKMDQFHNIHSTDTGFPLYPLTEGKINFAPTFKYDIGYNQYDTSEKQRIPSWCDRILYRGTVQQLNYQRHECTASDHRPVSSSFRISIKKMNLNKYQQIKNLCYEPCSKYLENMVNGEKIRWIMRKAKYNYEQSQVLLQSYNYNIDLLIESRAIDSI
ncbi:DNase I-like protein [Neocallimastix lanati (nom. inval.)]|nr:DNase I-like protein [Neocallimastix sp. JGI-2020a]